MPKITIPMAREDDVLAASDQLSRKVEQLEAAGKRITTIHHPALYADKLRIAESQNSAIYRGHPASGHHGGPYEIVIEYDA
jgi:hypothetical protein